MNNYHKWAPPPESSEVTYNKQTQQIKALNLQPTMRDSVYKGEIVYFNEWKDREGNLFFRQITSMAPFFKTNKESDNSKDKTRFKKTWQTMCKR